MALTPREAAIRLGAVAKDLNKTTVNAVRRTLTRVRTLTIDEVRKRGVLRRLFGTHASGSDKRAKSGLLPLIKRERVRVEGANIRGGLVLRGLVAIQETGGRTKPPRRGGVIKPKLKKALAFGGRVFKQVKHPGARLPAIPTAGGVMRRSEPLFKGGVDAAYRDLINAKLER